MINKFQSLSHFLNPTFGESITIPQGFGGDNCPIKSCLIKDGHSFTNKKGTNNLKTLNLYEKYLYFVSLIYNKYLQSYITTYRGTVTEEMPYVFFNMSSSSKHSLITKMLGMNNASVRKMFNFFIQYEFLTLYSEEVSFIDWTNHNSPKEKRARRFLVSPQFHRRGVIYRFRDHKNVERLNDSYERYIQYFFSNSSKLNFEGKLMSDDTIRSFTFPTYEELYKKAEVMVNEKMKDKVGRTYVWEIPKEHYHEDNGKKITVKRADGTTFSYTVQNKLKKDTPFVDITAHIQQYTLTMNGPKVLKKSKITHFNDNEYEDRFYSSLSLLPKWIRSEIKIGGEKIVEVDMTALHSRIVGKMYSERYKTEIPDFLRDDSHTKLASILGVDRGEAKKIGLCYWNSKIHNGKTISSKNNRELFHKMDRFIRDKYPLLKEYLEDVKCNMKSIKGTQPHSNMSVMLVNEEVKIMKKVILEINHNMIYCYDALWVTESKVNLTKDVFDKVLSSYFR